MKGCEERVKEQRNIGLLEEFRLEGLCVCPQLALIVRPEREGKLKSGRAEEITPADRRRERVAGGSSIEIVPTRMDRPLTYRGR